MTINIQNLPSATNTDHRVYSNFFADNHIIQNVSIVQPKNLIIDVLRKYFRNDLVYTYRDDNYGFPATPDITGLSVDDPSTTKILISDVFRYEIKFYPAITVKSGGGNYTPISFNQEGTIKYRKDQIENEFGGVTTILTPTHRVYAGAWDMTFEVSIYSESHVELEEITEITKMIFQYVSWHELRANGLFIKSLNISGESSEPYANDYIFSHTITLSTRSEWRVEIPLENIIEKISFYFDSVRSYIPYQTTSSDIQALKFNDIVEIANLTT